MRKELGNKIKKLLKFDNLIKRNINDSVGVDKGVKYKIEQWKENIPNIDEFASIEQAEAARDEYIKAQEDYFAMFDIESKTKANLDAELMSIFGVSDLSKIKYDWIKIALEGGNLQNDTKWETEEEFEILINASEKFTPERYQKLLNLSKQEFYAKKDLSESAKIMHEKQQQSKTIQELQRHGRPYQNQLDRANMLSSRIQLQLEKHKKLIDKINDVNERQMDEINNKYEQLESVIRQFESDIINRSASVKATTMIAEIVSNEIALQKGDISENALASQLEITIEKLKGDQIDDTQLTENTINLFSMCESLIIEEQSGLNAGNTQCNNYELEQENVKSYNHDNNDDLNLIRDMKKELSSIGVRIEDICNSSLSNSLGEYESISNKLEYYLEQVYNNFNASNPSMYNEKDAQEMLDKLAQLYVQLEECDKFIENDFQQVMDDVKSVSFDISRTIEQTQKQNAEYVFETNNWLVVGIGTLQQAMEEEQVNFPNNVEEIYNNYIEAQLKDCRETCVAVSTRTEIEIPVEFKANYNNLRQNMTTLNQNSSLQK